MHLIMERCDDMLTAASNIKEEINENEARLELYRLLGEGYKAMQEKKEITLEDLEKKIEQRRAERIVDGILKTLRGWTSSQSNTIM
ncbi:MAG: hypothetical protein K2L07_10630 [Lachnospiraceae bacterium]|nr:hypothetical protein [Lachnospiraceae bacterium]